MRLGDRRIARAASPASASRAASTGDSPDRATSAFPAAIPRSVAKARGPASMAVPPQPVDRFVRLRQRQRAQQARPQFVRRKRRPPLLQPLDLPPRRADRRRIPGRRLRGPRPAALPAPRRLHVPRRTQLAGARPPPPTPRGPAPTSAAACTAPPASSALANTPHPGPPATSAFPSAASKSCPTAPFGSPRSQTPACRPRSSPRRRSPAPPAASAAPCGNALRSAVSPAPAP